MEARESAMARDPATQVAAQWDRAIVTGLVIQEYGAGRNAGPWPCAIRHHHAGGCTITTDDEFLSSARPYRTASIRKISNDAAVIRCDSTRIAAIADSPTNGSSTTSYGEGVRIWCDKDDHKQAGKNYRRNFHGAPPIGVGAVHTKDFSFLD